MQPLGGRAIYLSDLQAAELQARTYLQLTWPFTADAQRAGAAVAGRRQALSPRAWACTGRRASRTTSTARTADFRPSWPSTTQPPAAAARFSRVHRRRQRQVADRSTRARSSAAASRRCRFGRSDRRQAHQPAGRFRRPRRRAGPRRLAQRATDQVAREARRTHAPYLPSRPAFASASVIRYLASNWPRPPRTHSVSPNSCAAVGAAAVAHQQRRHRVPTVALQHAGRAVVAGDDQHGRLERRDPRHGGVELFDPLHLGVEVAVFARAVGVLEVDEEEVVLRPVLARARRSARRASGPCRRCPCPPAAPGPCTSDRRRSPPPCRPYTSSYVGSFGLPAKPRSVRPLAFFSPAKQLRAPARRTPRRLRPSSRWPGRSPWARAAARPSLADRCRARRRPSPAPRKTTTKRCSFTGSTKTSTPGIFTSRSSIASGALSSLAMRPARRSVMLPPASSVQKLPRAATSLGCSSKPMPVASSAPRPMRYSSGS